MIEVSDTAIVAIVISLEAFTDDPLVSDVAGNGLSRQIQKPLLDRRCSSNGRPRFRIARPGRRGGCAAGEHRNS